MDQLSFCFSMGLSLQLFLESVPLKLKVPLLADSIKKIMKLCIIMNIILVSEDHFSWVDVNRRILRENESDIKPRNSDRRWKTCVASV